MKERLPKITIGQKPIYKKIAEDVDLFSLFQSIEEVHNNCFIFESLGDEGDFSRYSVIGFAPEMIISAHERTLTIDGVAYHVENPYQSLEEMMPQATIARNYAGGLVGYVGYDAVNYFESSLRVKIHPDFPQFMFGVYTDGVVLDKLTNELFYFYYTCDRSHLLDLKIGAHKVGQLSISSSGDSSDQQEHAEAVAYVQEEIRKGNTFQCEVGFKSKYKIRGDTVAIYEKLREVNPSPFMYFLKFGDKKIIGASPELLFSLRDGEMETRPLAGTVKRGKTMIEDRQLARTLLNNPKEIAEHTMLVDLHRNDIGRVAQFGTVKVRDLMSIKKFSHVQHISSTITGFIKPTETMFSGLASNFPAGTLSGAPKIESMKIIERLEKEARGPYGGAVGQFGFNGDCTFAIAIRTLFLAGESAFTQTSGGIVLDSTPEGEYQEIQRKLAAMKKVLSL
ncbi:MAG TPA: anthranilate synthase component I family protein [Patescibacteria group bacterium]|nr:anthranilate synthase component I family protein [Patescibacteria group bacterium]